MANDQSRTNVSPPASWYLFEESKDRNGKLKRTYFFSTQCEEVAGRLCRRLSNRFGTDEKALTSSLSAVNAVDLDEDERFFIDDEIERLHQLADPDPGIYDFPVNQRQVALYWQAFDWEERTMNDAKKRAENLNLDTSLSGIPALNRDDGTWVKNKLAAKLEGIDTRSLARYRTEGISAANNSVGKDPAGRVWRRSGNDTSHPWYFVSTLASRRKP